MRAQYSMLLAVMAASGSIASAGVIYGTNTIATSSVMHGGDRELVTMGFSGASNAFNGANFGVFTDGTMSSYDGAAPIGPFGWNDNQARDLSTAGNRYAGNPDRADGASNFLGEGSGLGTLGEVFGTARFGYKNMSYIIDGEGAHEDFTIDLYFGGGLSFIVDGDDNSVEVALLERGMNSDLKVRGIRPDHSVTSGVFIDREDWVHVGWDLDTLEIGGRQKVGGVGISLDESWGELIGFRIQGKDGYGGPDLVAVGSVTPVPSAGPIALAGAGVLAATTRRRRR